MCADCFHQLPECTCECGNFTLIQIDENIQYAVRTLNEKYYVTECCCEGHYEDWLKGGYIYISFDKRYAPKSFPDGWSVSYDNNRYHPSISIGMRIKSNSKFEDKRIKHFETEKQKALTQLNKWADELGINEDY